jgi:hypothetical protein
VSNKRGFAEGAGLGTTRRVLMAAVVAGACALVFLAWMNPHLAVEVASFVRSCF